MRRKEGIGIFDSLLVLGLLVPSPFRGSPEFLLPKYPHMCCFNASATLRL